ncbi:DUF349 domain-containing protein [Pseudonocardia spinosispora]|uniref:DUF349 domain-containing protein n=1 Tax=Pseudonocardia spinosispora TaxID=103441 RepID=UPI000421D5BD|nr:DUF349 domain-containing protein [Pseudonocardia spinosispora]
MVGHQETTGTHLTGADVRQEETTPEGSDQSISRAETPVAPAPRAENAERPARPSAVPSPAALAKPLPPAQRGSVRPVPAPSVPGPPASTSAADTPAPAPSAPAIVHPVPPACGDPSRWGRVDADGTVYLRTPDGEREVGSWQAGAPDEGLAHFARRFDDLLTEAELLATRLTTGGGDPKHALNSVRQLRESLADAAVIGDVAGLTAHLDSLIERAKEAVDGVRSAREASRAQAIARKEELAAEAEQLAEETTQWKHAGDRFKAILDEWRAIKGIDRKTDEQLWKRFSRARDGFNRRRGSHFADLDRQRASARSRKEELVVEAESLSGSTDWGPTAARYKQLMADWKAAGRAQKDADDTLWQRFRAAQEEFFSRRSAVFAERDAEFAANAELKEKLLVEAEHIDTSNADNARAALRSIHERWEEAGKVPRERIRELEDRMRAVEDRIREELDRRWHRSDPEADARVAQFRERVEQFEAQAAKARAAGDARRAERAEGQAEQWREWLATAEKAIQR